MFKLVVIFTIQILLVILLFTQIIIPLFTKLPFFWFFKKKSVDTSEPKIKELSELEKEAQDRTDSYKEMIDELEDASKHLEEIKDKTKIN